MKAFQLKAEQLLVTGSRAFPAGNNYESESISPAKTDYT